MHRRRHSRAPGPHQGTPCRADIARRAACRRAVLAQTQPSRAPQLEADMQARCVRVRDPSEPAPDTEAGGADGAHVRSIHPPSPPTFAPPPLARVPCVEFACVCARPTVVCGGAAAGV